jgi:flagellin
MKLILAHNIAAFFAINALQVNQNKSENSLQRLSTGLRINSAAYDAAGLAISKKMKAQIGVLQQAANGTLTDEDKMSIRDEMSHLKTGIDNIANGTEFNTLHLLNQQGTETPS